MEELYTIIVVAGLLWSIFGSVFDKRTKGRTSPSRRREEEAGAESWEWTTTNDRAGDDGGRAAAEVIPDDLWELLTGERRPPRAAPRQDECTVEPAATRAEPGRSEETARRVPTETRREDRVVRVAPEWEAPAVVSLEEPPPPPEVRHAAFHQKLERLQVAAPPRRRRSALGGRHDLRRAMILREILGPPKGLE